MTIEELKQLDHVSATEADGLIKITAHDGYQLKDKDGVTCTLLYCAPSTILPTYTIEEATEPNLEDVEIDKEAYDAKVNDLIRNRYTLSEELSILRQQSSKAEEYEAYYNYCEECKAEAKRILAAEALAYDNGDSGQQ